MKQTDDAFWTQVARYVRGELTEAEITALLNEPTDGDTDRAAALKQARTLWERSSALNTAYYPDVDQGWQRVKFRKANEEEAYAPAASPVVVRLWGKYVSVAASVVLILGLGYFLWRQVSAPEEVRLVATGQKAMYYLPDSSRVWLNQGSALRYSTDFAQAHRTVHLEGEAFFVVQKAEGRRFTVHSNLAQVEVIGTSFNVRSYNEDSVTVHVVTGRVAFSPTGQDNAIFLEPGQRGLLTKQQLVANRSAIRDPNFRAWQNDQLQFDNTQLERIIPLLERQYGVNIVLSNTDLADCRYTATFEEATLEEVLNVLGAVGNLSYQQTGRRVVISGAGCR